MHKQMALLMIMSTLFGFTSPARADSRLVCEKVFNIPYHELSQQITNREDRFVGENAAKLTNKSYHLGKLLVEATEILDMNQVQWKYTSREKTAIQILPVVDGSRLNRIAHGLFKNYRNTKVIYDPKDFSNGGGSLSYQNRPSTIFINAEVIAANRLTPLFRHEIRHMKNYDDFLEGSLDSPMSFTTRLGKKKITDTYDDYLFSDEVHTYVNQLYTMLGEPVGNTNVEKFANTTALGTYSEIGMSITAFLYENSSKHLDIINSFKKRPGSWEELDTYFWESGKRSIMIHSDTEKGQDNVKVHITGVEIADSNFSTTYQFAQDSKSLNSTEWIEKTSARLEKSMSRYGKLIDIWAKMDAAIRSENRKAALKAAEKMRALINEERAEARQTAF